MDNRTNNSQTGNEIERLVGLLNEKDDKLRYAAFLELQEAAQTSPAVYPYWAVFREKLHSENSYQRSIGLMLLAENAKWDTEGRMAETLDDYLAHLHDEKPITVRQCIQGLCKIVTRSSQLDAAIAARLLSLDLGEVRETMRKSILVDILNVLLLLRKRQTTEEIEAYLVRALTGGLLDKKTAKEIEAQL